MLDVMVSWRALINEYQYSFLRILFCFFNIWFCACVGSVSAKSPEVFCKKRCPQKFCKIHQRQGLFFNKVAGSGRLLLYLNIKFINFTSNHFMFRVLSVFLEKYFGEVKPIIENCHENVWLRISEKEYCR